MLKEFFLRYSYHFHFHRQNDALLVAYISKKRSQSIQYKKQKHRNETSLDALVEESRSGNQLPRQFVSKDRNQHDELVGKQLAEKIHDAENGLTERQRQVFRLHYVEGYKFREIAEMLGTTEDSIKDSGLEARRKLQTLLKEEFVRHNPGYKCKNNGPHRPKPDAVKQNDLVMSDAALELALS